MVLLDVNALVALAWDSHIHHEAIRGWFRANAHSGWATCSVTESGFTRVSSNAIVLPSAVSVEQARGVLRRLRLIGDHRFLTDDVSMTDSDIPALVSHRQVTDAHLLTIARRSRGRLLTFDKAIAALADGVGVEILSAL